MPNGHEVYPNAPLVLVTAQVTFAYEPRLNGFRARDQFASQIRERLPILADEMTSPGFQIDVEGEQARAKPIDQQHQLRATNEDRTASMVLGAQSITVEASEYVHFDGFADLLREGLTALTDTIGPLYVVRAGLRYIDEIRPPGIAATGDWSGWLSDALIAPIALLPDRQAAGINGVAAYQIADRVNVIVRWGEMQGTTIIAPNAALRLRPHPEGRFFVLDADSFWQPERPEKVDVDELLDRFHVLHEPIGEVFEASLTPKTRSLFRGEIVNA
jgi:uncharacterized protein (TIGR04255 family)